MLSDEYRFALGFSRFLTFLRHFLLAKLAYSSIRVKESVSSIAVLIVSVDEKGTLTLEDHVEFPYEPS